MKTNYLKTVLIAIFAIAFCVANADTFHSISAGGEWTDTATWEENAVPSASDDVIITGPGEVYVVGYNASTHDECYNLTINPGALLRHKTNGTRGLDVFGTLLNNGTISDTTISGYVYIHTYGDIENNGIWNNRRLLFEGTGTQYVTCGSNNYFGCYEVNDNDNTSDIETLSDIEFRDSRIDLNNATLTLPVTKGGTLTILGGHISDAIIVGNFGNLVMDDISYINNNVTISDITLQGIVNINSNTNVMEGDIAVEGTLKNRTSSATLYVNGNLSNEGIIQNTNNYLTLHITGDIYNNGTWQNRNTWLSDTGNHSVTQGVSGSFAGQNFYAETGTGLITAYSTLDFNGVTVDLNGNTVYCDPVKGEGLNFTDGILMDGTVYGNNNELTMDIDSYLGNITIHDFVLTGTVPIFSHNVVFEGNMVVEGVLKNSGLSSNLTVNGPLTNNGTIENLSNYLNLYLNNDFINNGVCTNRKIIFNSSSDQQVSCLNNNIIVAREIANTDPAAKIIATDDLFFHTSIINLNGGEIQMPQGKIFSLTGTSSSVGRLYNGTISGESFDYEGNDEAYIQSFTFEPEVTFHGEIHVLTEVNFNGSFIIMDTIQLYGLGCTINTAGRIINNGVIQDGTGNHLTINCQDHIINNGTWTNYRTTLNGVDDQLIYLIAGKEITGDFRFNAMIDDPPHQWKWNGAILNSSDFTGETSNLLEWEVPVSTDYLGDFKCYGASDSSRAILIRSGIIIDPVVQLQGPYNGVDMDTELAAQSLIPLEQPFNVAPWNYTGDEVVTSIPSDIVDWILVELRETTGGPETATSDSIVMRRALLLRNDGRVVDPYHQTPELKYDIDLNDNIYMVIWHRNHLGVMSAVPISDGDSPAFYDFSESTAQAYGGTDALIDMGDGVYGMMGGDADYSQTITQQDKNGFWDPNVGLPCGYEPYDFTLDGQMDNQDKNQTWSKTLGAETQVPE